VTSLDDYGIDLLQSLLVYDPAGRISAKQCMLQPYFTGLNGYTSNGNGFH
jgi:cyclin-dependent kinase